MGDGADVALEITRSDKNDYQGSVGNIAAEIFPQCASSCELFSYVCKDQPTDQTFEVINYWVD